jgi:hypothetical protein
MWSKHSVAQEEVFIVSQTDRSESKGDRTSESEQKPTTSSKVADESITAETQAQPYEPKFTSFSGAGDAQTLSALHSHRERAAQFVVVDEEAGKEHTAQGERYRPRQSFMEGIKAILDKSTSPEQQAELQGKFSIEYIIRKAKELAGAVAHAVTPPAEVRSNKSRIFEDVQQFVDQLKPQPDSILVASNPEVASDGIGVTGPAHQSPSKSVEKREVDLSPGSITESTLNFFGGFVGWHQPKAQISSPQDVVTVSWPGKPGAPLSTIEKGSAEWFPEKRLDEFVADLYTARQAVLERFPNAPPLVCLDVESSSIPTAKRESVAATAAYVTGLWVLGKGADGKYKLFDPNGKQRPEEIDNLDSAEQWSKIKEITRQHWTGNRIHRPRIPDYHETPDARTTAPPEVISMSFHGVPGSPEHMKIDELLKIAQKLKHDVLTDPERPHRDPGQPTIIELHGCNTGSAEKGFSWNNVVREFIPFDSEDTLPSGLIDNLPVLQREDLGKEPITSLSTVAGRVAKETNSWTIGYQGLTNETTGRSYHHPLVPWGTGGTGAMAILFNPKGEVKGLYRTPISEEDWKKIIKLSEQPK